MTDNDALVREQIADIIDERVSSPASYGDQNMEAAHRRDQLRAADEILAALRSTPQAEPMQAYPETIGRLHLGEKRSGGERLCSWGHEVLAGQPLYWPQAISQYDDSDPCCIEHAIEQYASEAGYGADAANLSATDAELIAQAKPLDLPAQDEVGAAELCRQTARELRENGDGDCNAAMQAIRWDERAAALDRHRAGDDALREENARLRGALENAGDAIDEMFRYFDGGETRGSYDGKPERAQLRKAGYAVRAALTGRQG